MIIIKHPTELDRVTDPVVHRAVQQSQAQVLADFPEPYTPETHGWYLVIETEADALDSTPLHQCLSTAQLVRGKWFEHARHLGGWYEVVVAVSDSEAIAIYVPEAIAAGLGLEAVLIAALPGED